MNNKIEIRKEELQELYLTKKNREICNILQISMPTLMSYLKKAKIELKGSGNRETKAKVIITK
jgi:hypothetical protein